MKQKFQIIIAIAFAIMSISCSHKYLPIVKTNGYYAPVPTAKYVEVVPASAVYIGTIKAVPRDYSFATKSDYEIAIRNLQEAAAKAGANYIYVTYVSAPNKDYYNHFFNAVTQSFGEGLVIEAELYK